ncbi:MAG: SUMF1/EgtB/PvdO family nonheme iron enzyme [Methylomonas sp.]|jgi:hypothetical protein
MDLIQNAIFLELAGDTPSSFGLIPLKSAEKTASIISGAFSPFFKEDVALRHLRDLTELDGHTKEFSLIYVFGHGWLQDGEYETAVLEDGNTKSFSGTELFQLLLSFYSGNVLLVIDTCHAAALKKTAQSLRPEAWFIIFGSSIEESAIEYTTEGSRLSLALAETLSKSQNQAITDFLEIFVDTKRILAKPKLVASQTVECWFSGEPIKLENKGISAIQSHARTHTILKSLFIASGAILALMLIFIGWYTHNHFIMEIQVSDLQNVLDQPNLVVKSEFPDINDETILEKRNIQSSGLLRLRLPEVNLLFTIEGNFKDGLPRKLHYHVVRSPSWDLQQKQMLWILPSNDQIAKHPNMAFIPPIRWLSGADRKETENLKGFWIDLFPPTVAQYLPQVKRWLSEGKIEIHESVLLSEMNNASATESVGLKQLPGLLGDLNHAFAIMQTEDRAARKPDNESVPLLPWAKTPCPDCPAPLSKTEAQKFCDMRGLSITTATEWELAARGADGRLYPWGNKWDSEKGSAGLPVQIGKPMELKPVNAYPKGESPFGLMDMVGNAGDWVDTEGGFLNAHMGGIYSYNEEEAYTFKLMPDRGEIQPMKQITARCVSKDFS